MHLKRGAVQNSVDNVLVILTLPIHGYVSLVLIFKQIDNNMEENLPLETAKCIGVSFLSLSALILASFSMRSSATGSWSKEKE